MGDPIEAVRTTRRGLLAGGLGSGVALLMPGPAAGAPPGAAGDVAWLARLTRVELLVQYCYDRVLAGTVMRPPAHAVVLELRAHATAHVAALRGALRRRGGSAPAGPADVAAADRDLARRQVSGRLARLRGPRDALNLLLALERVAVGAYFVALAEVSEPALSVLLAQMMASDAQHEAILHEQLHPGDIARAIPYGLVGGVQ